MASPRERVPEEDGDDRFEDVPCEEEPEAPKDDATATLERLPKLKLGAKGSSKGDKKRTRTRTRKRRDTKQEERCNQAHNQAMSQRMEMMMMSTMLKGYQRGHSSLTPHPGHFSAENR